MPAGGALNVQFCTYRVPPVEALGEAGREAHHAWTDDYNPAHQDGFARLQMTIRPGRLSECRFGRPAPGTRKA